MIVYRVRLWLARLLFKDVMDQCTDAGSAAATNDIYEWLRGIGEVHLANRVYSRGEDAGSPEPTPQPTERRKRQRGLPWA